MTTQIKNILLLALVSFILCIPTANAYASKAKIISKTVESAFRVSKRAATPAARRAMEQMLKTATKKYGDDVLRIVGKGGVESLKVIERYGDDFVRFCNKAGGKSIRTLVLHADEMVPLVKRIGPSFVELETNVPGLATKAVRHFGDDGVKYLAKVPKKDAAKLIGYASYATDPAAKKCLLECYGKSGGKILKYLDWKKIAAGGLSVATITAAYKMSNGVEEGIKEAVAKNPETFIEHVTRPLHWVFAALAILIALPTVVRFRRELLAMLWWICRGIGRGVSCAYSAVARAWH